MPLCFRVFLVLAMASSLAACGDPAIPYDPGAGAKIQTIGILSMHWPDSPVAPIAANPGFAIPVVGGLAAIAEEKARNLRLHNLARARRFRPDGPFIDDVRSALAAEGYHAITVELPRGGFGYLSDYSKLSGADAWLDCVGLQWGFMAAGIGTDEPFRPTIWVKCQLVRASDRTVLMRDIIMYNSLARSAAFVSVPPDPAYAFTDTDALMADPERTIAAMNAGLQGTAQALAKELK